MKGKRAFKLVNGKVTEVKMERNIDLATTSERRRSYKRSSEPISDMALFTLLLITVGTIILSALLLGGYGGK